MDHGETRASGSLEVVPSATDLLSAPKPRSFSFIKKTTMRTLTLKCKCGSVWKFAESSDAQPPGTQPIPTGDSFVCPQCGSSIDLKAERQLEAEALANLNLGNKI